MRYLVQAFLKSTRSPYRGFILCQVLLVVCLCSKESNGVRNPDGFKHSALQAYHLVHKRQQSPSSGPTTIPDDASTGLDVGVFFASYWFIFVVLIIFVVIVSVFVCACAVKVRKRNHQSQTLSLESNRSPESNRSLHQQRSLDEHSLPQLTGSSVAGGSPISLSVGPTPIPSPQPSAASSQRSYRSNGQGGKRRRNHSSGHVSSSSEETIRAHDFHSTSSLMSHSSSFSHNGIVHPIVSRTESMNSSNGDRVSHYAHRHNGRHRHKRATSNPHIKVFPSGGPDSHSLYSAPSTSSMHSMESVRSGLSHRSHSDSQKTLVDVDVTVHLSSEHDHETRKEIAAALAESARKLAQSAANFDEEDSYSIQRNPHRSHSQLSSRGFSQPSTLQSKRQLFPSHSSSVLVGHESMVSRSLSSPAGPPTVSLDRPRNGATLDRPHHTFPIRTELARRNSLNRAPPPESPLRISHSRYSSQRSLSSESAPSTKLPVHMRVHRKHSVDGHMSGMSMPLSQREVSLDNLHNSPSPPHPSMFTPRPILEDTAHFTILAPAPNQASASLDFSGSSPLSSSPDGAYSFNGIHSPRSHSHLRMDGLHSVLESDHGISPDSGMGNGDYGTGTESSSSTLKSSSLVDKKDRLSRLSEKSIENLDYEEGETSNTHNSSREGLGNGNTHTENLVNGTRAEANTNNLTENNEHSSPRTRISFSSSQQSPLSNGHNLPPSDSGANTNSNRTAHTHHNQHSTHKIPRHPYPANSVTQPDPSSVTPTNNTHSVSSSGSAASLDENSMASGYAATGSGSSAENIQQTSSQSHDAQVMHNDIETQFSYPLERLLAQPLCYDIESENISPAPLAVSTTVANHKQNHHRHVLSYSDDSHSQCQVQRSSNYHPHNTVGELQTHNGHQPLQLNTHKRTRSESKLVPGPYVTRPGQLHIPYHSNHHIQANNYQSGSITVDV